jgi:hypothetical protein
VLSLRSFCKQREIEVLKAIKVWIVDLCYVTRRGLVSVLWNNNLQDILASKFNTGVSINLHSD